MTGVRQSEVSRRGDGPCVLCTLLEGGGKNTSTVRATLVTTNALPASPFRRGKIGTTRAHGIVSCVALFRGDFTPFLPAFPGAPPVTLTLNYCI